MGAQSRRAGKIEDLLGLLFRGRCSIGYAMPCLLVVIYPNEGGSEVLAMADTLVKLGGFLE